jgi:hypothetical protein
LLEEKIGRYGGVRGDALSNLGFTKQLVIVKASISGTSCKQGGEK